MKNLIHDECGGEVNRRTLVCSKCGTKPLAKKLTLNKQKQ